MWMGSVKIQDMLLILDRIISISITQVTSRGRIINPSSCFMLKSVHTEMKPSCTAEDMLSKVKEHVFRKSVR